MPYRYPFLPTTRADLDARGWDAVDIVIVSGDAHVDHPAFGPILIARFLEGRGFRVGVIAQPDWHSAEPQWLGSGESVVLGAPSDDDVTAVLHRVLRQAQRDFGDEGASWADDEYETMQQQAIRELPVSMRAVEFERETAWPRTKRAAAAQSLQKMIQPTAGCPGPARARSVAW